MNSIKIAAALLLDKITGIFSKKEEVTSAPVYQEVVIENIIHPTTTPAPLAEEVSVKTEETKKPKAKSRKKPKKG